VLRFSSATAPRSNAGTIRKVGERRYELPLEGRRSYIVSRTE
jgi:hypothetical protein